MLPKTLKVLSLSLVSYLSTCVLAGAASFVTDFNSGIPAGASPAGSTAWSSTNGVGNSGVVKLVYPAPTGLTGGLTVNDIAGGVAITNLQVKYKTLVGGGTCCLGADNVTPRPADGVSFNFATGIAGSQPGINGAGNGLTVTFDTWDNNDSGEVGDTAPAIELKWGGSTIAVQSTAGYRCCSAPVTPILTNSAGGPVSIETTAPATDGFPNPATFVDVVIELFADNTVSVTYSNVVVFNHVAIPYAPIAGGAFVWGGHTGGANENNWIDDLRILANYVPGPAIITSQPADQTVTESQTASFSIQVNGTPPYSIQWFSNAPSATPVAIPGATALSYTTPPATVAMNGLQYHAEVTGGESTSPAISEIATLHVNSGVLVTAVASRLYTNRIYVTFNKPVSLVGTYSVDNGVTIGSSGYGSSHSEVILNTSQLVSETTYCVTVAGEKGEDSSSMITDPSTVCFRHGVGSFCTDFSSLPPNSAVYGDGVASGYIGGDGVLHITDAANNLAGAWVYSGLDGSIDRFDATFRLKLGNGTCCDRYLSGTNNIADGMSFNIANDLPNAGSFGAEDGVGTGLSVTFDTWDNSGGEAPAMDLKWKGNFFAHAAVSPETTDFVDVHVHLDPDGTVDLSYNGSVIFNNVQIPNFTQILNPRLGFYARTGGANEQAWVDNFCITQAYTLGPVSITQQPQSQTALETYTATFQVVLDGSPPYSIQWYSNDVANPTQFTAIPNGTNETYTTPPVRPAQSGTLFHAIISNAQNSVQSSDAVLTVTPGVLLLSASAVDATHVSVTYSKGVVLASGTYTFTGGISESSRAYGASHSVVVITVTPAMTRDTSFTVTVNNVVGEDASPLVPNPSSAAFRFGFGAFCTDFNAPDDVPPAGTHYYVDPNNITPYITNGVLHLTDLGQPGHYGAWAISNRTDGLPLDRVYAQFDMRLAGTSPADGVGFSWGSDVLSGVGSGEEGIGTGLTVAFDTYANTTTDLGFRIKWKGVQIASKIFPVTIGNSSTNIVKQKFVPVAIGLDPSGIFNMFYDNQQIFTNLQLPNFAPIANSAYSFTARVGGANEDAWLDNLCINSFTPGPLHFVTQPVDTTGAEFQSATFNTTVDGNPLYFYQWFTNGTPVAGANAFSLTLSPLTASMEGVQVSIRVTNTVGEIITSTNATLHVSLNPRLVRTDYCAPASRPGHIFIYYTRPVFLDSGTYSLDHDGAEATRNYLDSSHQVIDLAIDSTFIPNATYQLTIQDVQNEAQTLTMDPNPSSSTFTIGYLSTTNDFNSANFPSNTVAGTSIGHNMTIYGNTYVSNGVLHITDAGNSTAQQGGMRVTNINNGAAANRFVIRYRMNLSSLAANASQPYGTATPADGGSVNIGQNLTAGTGPGEGGTGNGLSVCFDNWDNVVSGSLSGDPRAEAPAINVKWAGVYVRSTTNTAFPETFKDPRLQMATIIRSPNPTSFYDVYIDLEPDGKVYVNVNGNEIFNGIQTPFNGSMANAQLGIYGRTGGANENFWIDDLSINAESITDPVIIRQPVDVTTNEGSQVTFSVDADGMPPFRYQWYSNNVAVAGGTNASLTTVPLNRSADLAAYKVVVTSTCAALDAVNATSSDAIVHIIQDTTPPSLMWVGPDVTYTNLLVLWSEAMDPTTAQVAANYSITPSGPSVVAATLVQYATNRYMWLRLSQALNPANCNILAINTNVKDASMQNSVSNRRVIIPMKGAFQTVGSSNMVVMEAEDFDANRSPGLGSLAAGWVFANSLPGFIGTGYMDAAPNATVLEAVDTVPSAFIRGTMAALSSLDYAVNFNATGTYYIFARGSTANDGGNNSFQLLLDGGLQSNNQRQIGNAFPNWGGDGANVNKFGWVNHANGVAATRAFITVPTTGLHMLTVVMREDGLKLDRFFLTTDANAFLSLTNLANNATFQDPGPAAPAGSSRPNLQNLTIIHGPQSSAQISWGGLGWTLQATATLSNTPGTTVWQDTPYTSPLGIPAGYFGPGQTNIFFRLICK